MTLAHATKNRLAQALHAYVRATPARDLPHELRRWQSFRPRAMAPHVSEMVAALDDEGLRDRILEWLDEKPHLAKQDAELLRLASERPNGWEKEADGSSSKRPEAPTGDPTAKLRDRLAREKERTVHAKEDVRRARDEARRAKEDARRAQQSEQKKVADLNKQLAATARDLERTRAALEKSQNDLKRNQVGVERERRRDRRTTEKAVTERDELKTQLREARKEITDLGRRLREAQARPTVKKTPRKSSAPPAKPARRKRLPPPKGLFEDAPETLMSWLTTPDVRLLVDGYNVTKAPTGFGDLNLEAQRERLVDTAVQLARKHSVPMTIVFDGSEEPTGTKRRSRQGVKVEYSKPDEIADDHLIALLDSLPPDPVVVVTNDRELQHRAKRKGATIAGSDQFLALRR